jgi:flagellar biosynthesis anti-sigma factor FlgM
MRVDLFNSSAAELASELKSAQVATQKASQGASAPSEDTTTLTSTSNSIDSLVSQVLQSPEIRQEKVASLSQAINSGQYELDPQAIAASMIDEHA